MKKRIILVALSALTSSSFAELDIDKYNLFPEHIRTYSPAESCTKANEALKVLTRMQNERAEKLHACLQRQLKEDKPSPTVCTFEYVSLRNMGDYEMLREIDCNPKRDPAFPRRTSAYNFLQ